MGLLLEGDHLRRQFCGGAELREVDKLPALELTAIAEVEVLGEGVVLPSAAVIDGGSAPHAGGAVEVHEPPGAVARGVLDDEMAIEEDRLGAGQKRRFAVEVVPADLHHADLVFREIVDGVEQDVLGGEEIGVEDGDELPGCNLHRLRQRPGLVAFAVGPVDVLDGVALGGHLLDGLFGDVGGVVGAVVQNLDLQLVQRVVDLAGGADNPGGDRVLVVHRELDRHPREVLEAVFGLIPVVAVLEVQVHQDVAVEPVERHKRQHGHVRGDE